MNLENYTKEVTYRDAKYTVTFIYSCNNYSIFVDKNKYGNISVEGADDINIIKAQVQQAVLEHVKELERVRLIHEEEKELVQQFENWDGQIL